MWTQPAVMDPSASVQPPAPTFQEAFIALLSLAPGPVFPRARQLYLRKYPLEGSPAQLEAQASQSRFRSFLLQEEIQEGSDGVYRVRAAAFAVVHWHAPQTNPADYLTYLRQRWLLEPEDLELQSDQWFRGGGAYARFTAPAVYERQGASQLRLSLAQAPHPSSS